MKFSQRLLSLCFAVLFVSCEPEIEKAEPLAEKVAPANLFALLSPQDTGVDFENTISENEEVNFLEWDAVYYGGGVALADFNNDGLLDLFFCGNQVDDAIYLNKGDLTFEDITHTSGIIEHAGWSNGVSIVDINEDGFADIYVCRSGWLADDEMLEERRNKLFINNQDLTFTEAAKQYGLDNEGYSTQATWFDYDKDGDQDMFLLNAPSNNLKQKVKYNQVGFPDYVKDKFFRNDGGKFTEIGAQLGLDGLSFGLGVVAADFNHDNWTDLYVANDYDRPDYMYINDQKGSFTNALNSKVKHTCFTAMGVDAADFNNDALIDLAVLDMQSEDHYRSKTNMPSMSSDRFWGLVNKGYNYQYMSNVLQLNNGQGFFSDIAQMAGVASTDWSWSVLMADYDLDGYKDLYVTNGINKDIRNNDFSLAFEQKMANNEAIDLFELTKETPSTKISNYAFHNQGDLTFKKVMNDWGMDQTSFSYGAAYGDLDNDGDLDLVVNNNNMPAFIYENSAATSANWLKVEVKGKTGFNDHLNSKAIVFANGQKQYCELTATRGYQSSCSPIMHFGLGDVNKIDSLLVIFPDGSSWKKKNVEVNQVLTVAASQGQMMPFYVYGEIKPLFKEVTDELGISFTHVENDFDDFKEEVLLPHRQSRNGPYTAVGKINGDEFDDVFIGGAAGQSGALLVQTSDGSFTTKKGPWSKHAKQEDMGCAFFDLEGDGDLDLYVASGGGHLAKDDPAFADRLYINDGQGNFTVSNDHPGLTGNASCVVSGDIDGDGDMDLFVGGRAYPQKYPHAGQSFILINSDGVLTDETEAWSPVIGEIGMVTSAALTDVNGDGKNDLMIVGEWMTPSLFLQVEGAFVASDQPVDQLSGWWQNVTAADIDEDGDMDFLLGNMGLNNKFHPSQEKPLKIYSDDFDGNQTNDIVLAKMSKNRYVPVRGRECSSQQMPFVSEKFENYEGYATASLDEIYGEALDQALFHQVNEFRSGIYRNDNGKFTFEPLPNQVQIAPIMDFVVDDFNKDGSLDILSAGNHFDAEVETTRYDASNGCLLLNSPNGFIPNNVLYSGFYAPFNTKDLSVVTLAQGKCAILVASNNGRLTAFSFTP